MQTCWAIFLTSWSIVIYIDFEIDISDDILWFYLRNLRGILCFVN